MSDITYWQWIPSINRELDLVGNGRVIDTKMTNELKQVSATLLRDANNCFKDAEGTISIHADDVRYLFVLHDYRTKDGTDEIDASIISTDDNKDDLTVVTLRLEKPGLLSMCFHDVGECSADCLDAISKSLFDYISSLYHTHAHPRYGSTIGIYRGDDRSKALKWICDAYEERLASDVSNYRNNPKEPGVFFNIKSCALYARSFLDKYGDCLGDDKRDLEYICRYAEESADHTYLSREYKMNHGASENMASMNNRMFVLMMLSIAMSFFAGSIFNEAIGGMSKSALTISGAVAFIAAGYFGLRYAHERSEKEKDGLYTE